MKIIDAKVFQDFKNGKIHGDEVVTSVKLLKDARHFYKSNDATLSDDTIMYEVYMYTQNNPKQVGNLNWGMTVMKPVYVNGECNMTRGHFHEDLECAEFYFGIGGEGLLMLMDENFNCTAQRVCEGSVHHIDGKIAHRLINTGETDFKVGACWPTTAGHDYKRIEEGPFTQRIFKIDGNIVSEERE